LAVYTGTTVSNLTTIVYNDDIGSGIYTSSVSFLAGAGTVYQIAVDGYGGAQGNIVLNVQQSGAAPQFTVQPQSQTVISGTDAAFTVGANGTTPFSYQWRKNAASINGANNSTLQLTNAQASASGSYSVIVSNAFGSVTSSNAVLVVSANHPPVGNNDSYSMNANTSLVIPGPGVLANDSDADGDSLAAVLVSGPAHGALSLNADGSFSYTPGSNYHGPDTFTYMPFDGQVSGNTATVSITIN
jgi:VCBS repeat-containing protein